MVVKPPRIPWLKGAFIPLSFLFLKPLSVILSIVGREAIENVMRGFNATIFAYGQTGSGKCAAFVFNHVQTLADQGSML
jgi:hypothetical protein